MRYTVKWTNGYWKVFDNHRFTDASLCYLKKDAEAKAAKMNKGKK